MLLLRRRGRLGWVRRSPSGVKRWGGVGGASADHAQGVIKVGVGLKRRWRELLLLLPLLVVRFRGLLLLLGEEVAAGVLRWRRPCLNPRDEGAVAVLLKVLLVRAAAAHGEDATPVGISGIPVAVRKRLLLPVEVQLRSRERTPGTLLLLLLLLWVSSVEQLLLVSQVRLHVALIASGGRPIERALKEVVQLLAARFHVD